MKENAIHTVVIIGAGNVATHLAMALYQAEVNISQVISRNPESAEKLSELVHAGFTTDWKELDTGADLYILSVPDDVIPEILDKNLWKDKILVHTAGSVSLDIFKNYTDFYGVFYPLQTFSKNKEVDFSQIPLCIEANSQGVFNNLEELASKISERIYHVNSEQRQKLHLSAVFACNFTNHLWSISEQLLNEDRLGFEMIKPLIGETYHKAMKQSPYQAQTGPALRNDQNTLKKHEKALEKHPELKKLYTELCLALCFKKRLPHGHYYRGKYRCGKNTLPKAWSRRYLHAIIQ